MKTFVLVTLLCVTINGVCLAEADKPVVQMAVLLDTSGSMSGLIDQARAELWSIVNEFIFARRAGAAPEVRVALFEYGKSALPQEQGYIRMIVPFTTDLDKVSQELFALTTNGGDEYCGWVIQEAVRQLDWSDRPSDLKVIFIAGNEPFTQGPVDFRQTCKAAIEKGIVVNTIHCGSETEGLYGQWKDGALAADGRFLNIDQNRQIVHIPAPQDDQIAALNIRLNGTYIAYGARGMAMLENQAAQDRNAATLSPEAATQRAVTKASANYANAHWDLVDAIRNRQVQLDAVDANALPEPMRAMDEKQRKAYVDEKAGERADLQKQIQDLNEQRRQFVAAELAKQQQAGSQTLGSAILQAVRDQAQAKQFTFEAPKPAVKTKGENGGR